MSMVMLVLVVVMGVVAGEPTVPGCCTPPQWEGIKSGMLGRVQGGVPRVEQEIWHISYDENSSKIAYNISMTLNGQTQYTRRIFDYKKRVQYVVDLNQQICRHEVIPTSFYKSCLPAEATQEGGKFYYGVGNVTIPALSFFDSKDKFNITTVMTADNCFPVAQVTTYSDTSNGASMESVDFINYTLGIKHPSVFTPPGYCQSPQKSEELPLKEQPIFKNVNTLMDQKGVNP